MTRITSTVAAKYIEVADKAEEAIARDTTSSIYLGNFVPFLVVTWLTQAYSWRRNSTDLLLSSGRC